jgi:hypothetical protein
MYSTVAAVPAHPLQPVNFFFGSVALRITELHPTMETKQM